MAIALTVLAVACALYGALIMAVGSGTWFFAFWFVLAALLLGAAWTVHAGWWSSLPIMAKRTAGIAGAFILLCFVATQICIAQNFGDQGEEDLDYLIVLGAQVRTDGPSVVLQNRLDTALDYLERNPETRCIVTGGKGWNEPATEASVMGDYLVERGIDESRIIREERSEDTGENIANSMEFLDPENDTVGIVTNNFHVFRGVRLARKAGIAHACGIAAPSVPLYLPNNLTRESLSIAKAFVEGSL